MKRRNFIKNIGKLSSAPLLLNGIGLSTFATQDMLQLLTTCTGVTERSLVVLFLKGGNDGLNTILPVDQYATYIGHRPNIGLAETGAGAYVNLDTSLPIADQVGIHPNITSFKNMYESGKARLIQAVGYPSFNQSHFKSTDLWLSGKDGNQSAATNSGWIGRFFENAYPGVHGNPNVNFPDPLGIQLGDSKASLSFHDCTSTYEATNLSGQSPSSLFGLLNGLGTAPHATPIASEYGTEIDYIMSVENNTNVYGQRISNVFNAGTNSSTVYPSTNLGDQLATIAKMLSGGSKTKVFLTHRNGFDTHVGQVDAGNASAGDHASLLADVFDSIQAFHNDLSNLALGNKVVTVVFSEFSRRITENGGLGTDHGNFGPMFLFGDAVQPGISGTNFNLNNINGSGNMNEGEMQYDYRSVFKTLLQDWLGTGSNILNPMEFGSYALIPNLINSNQIVDPSCYINPLLPIELSRFDVWLNQAQKVELNWTTASESNTDYFEVVRIQEGKNMETIDRINAAGNSNTQKHYEALDLNPLKGISYYMIRTINLDGTEELSERRVIELKEKSLEHVKIYPNPAVYNFNLVLTSDKNRAAILEIYTVTGQRVYTESLTIQKGFNKFSVNLGNIQEGQYLVKLLGENLIVPSMKLLVGRA